MRTISSMMIAALLAATLGGCIVRTRGHGHHHGHSTVRSRDCPPAHHWNGRACVHNGKAKGHRK